MDAKYRFKGRSIPGFAVNELTKFAYTIEPSLTTFTMFKGYQIGWTFGAMFISDMPTIVHTAGSPASLDTDDAVTLNASLEIML